MLKLSKTLVQVQAQVSTVIGRFFRSSINRLTQKLFQFQGHKNFAVSHKTILFHFKIRRNSSYIMKGEFFFSFFCCLAQRKPSSPSDNTAHYSTTGHTKKLHTVTHDTAQSLSPGCQTKAKAVEPTTLLPGCLGLRPPLRV